MEIMNSVLLDIWKEWYMPALGILDQTKSDLFWKAFKLGCCSLFYSLDELNILVNFIWIVLFVLNCKFVLSMFRWKNQPENTSKENKILFLQSSNSHFLLGIISLLTWFQTGFFVLSHYLFDPTKIIVVLGQIQANIIGVGIIPNTVSETCTCNLARDSFDTKFHKESCIRLLKD